MQNCHLKRSSCNICMFCFMAMKHRSGHIMWGTNMVCLCVCADLQLKYYVCNSRYEVKFWWWRLFCFLLPLSVSFSDVVIVKNNEVQKKKRPFIWPFTSQKCYPNPEFWKLKEVTDWSQHVTLSVFESDCIQICSKEPKIWWALQLHRVYFEHRLIWTCQKTWLLHPF